MVQTKPSLEATSILTQGDADKHFRSRHLQIYHRGEWLVNFIGKFENMQKDWRTLAEQTGIEKKSRLG